MAKAARKRFELIGKKKSQIVAITILSEKVGQKDVKPAVCVSLTTSLSNKQALPMFSANLLAFLYENTGKNTGALEGIDVVSDVPNLTDEAVRLGALDWDYEQQGSTLKIYNGVSGHADIVLRSGTVQKIKLACNEGGTVDIHWQFYTNDVDEDTIGALGILKSLERDVEMTAPEIVSDKQPTLIDDTGGELGVQTPESALAKAHAADSKKPKK